MSEQEQEQERRADFFERAAAMTPYVAARMGDEIFFVATGDEGLERGLFVRGSRSDVTTLETALRWLDEHGASRPEDAVFVEVGANIGTTTVAALRRFGFASAVALEPSPASFRTLRLNLSVNEVDERVTALELAASDRSGELPFDTEQKHPGGHRLARKEKERALPVRVVTLDGLVDEGVIDPSRAGLLWVDVAGHEPEVLCGARRLFEAGVPVVAALRPPRTSAEIKTALVSIVTEAGYTDVVELRNEYAEHGIEGIRAVLDSEQKTRDVLIARR